MLSRWHDVSRTCSIAGEDWLCLDSITVINWDTRREALEMYEEEQGHTNAPRSHPTIQSVYIL